MLQCPGPALGNNDARWNDDGRCPQLAAFVKALAAQKVGQTLHASQIRFKASAVTTERS